jgi:hypothetical protein
MQHHKQTDSPNCNVVLKLPDGREQTIDVPRIPERGEKLEMLESEDILTVEELRYSIPDLDEPRNPDKACLCTIYVVLKVGTE